MRVIERQCNSDIDKQELTPEQMRVIERQCNSDIDKQELACTELSKQLLMWISQWNSPACVCVCVCVCVCMWVWVHACVYACFSGTFSKQ